MNEILVGIDGSPSAKRAAHLAIEIAACLRWAIRGLYVVDEALVMDPYAPFQKELVGKRVIAGRTDLIDAFKQKGDICLTWLEAECKKASVPVVGDLFFGGVSEIILQQGLNASALALGRRGNSHSNDAHLLGAHFRNIVKEVRVPILVEGTDARPLKSVLLISHETAEIRNSLPWIVPFQRLGVKVNVLIDGQNQRRKRNIEPVTIAELERGGLTEFGLAFQPVRAISDVAAAIGRFRPDIVIIRNDRPRPRLMNQLLLSNPLPMLLI